MSDFAGAAESSPTSLSVAIFWSLQGERGTYNIHGYLDFFFGMSTGPIPTRRLAGICIHINALAAEAIIMTSFYVSAA